MKAPEPFRVSGLRVTLQDKRDDSDTWLEVHFLTEGGGFFLELKTQSIDDKRGFAIDPLELVALAEWAKGIAEKLDEGEK